MATVQVTHTWEDGSQTCVVLQAKVRTPEALTMLRLEAKRVWADTIDKLTSAAAIEADEAGEVG